MSIIGTYTNRKNPEYTVDNFTFWMPQFTNLMQTDDGKKYFTNIYPIVNEKIFKSIYGTDWYLAMSLAIAHYITLIAQQNQAPSGDTLDTIAGGGATKGVLTSMSVGGFSKSYDLDKTMSNDEEAQFWNLTSYGAQLWALLKTKPIASIMVVTSNKIPPHGGHYGTKKPRR